MKILAAQINPFVGDLDGNTKKILHFLDQARMKKADIVLFPEMAICGYPAEDLLFFPKFIEKAEEHLEKIIKGSSGLFVVVGFPRKNPTKGQPFFNSAAIIHDCKLLGFQDKTLLPNYDVFNEMRYFEPAKERKIWNFKDKKIGVLICEDAWEHSSEITQTRYWVDPVNDFAKLKPDLMLVMSASPYYFKKRDLRTKVYGKVAKTLKTPLVLCNQVGANDQLVFDGHSLFFDKNGDLKQIAEGFLEDEFLIDLNYQESCIVEEDPIKDLYRALVLGVKDYFGKQGFSKACLGLSGGIDSALTACIAADALGSNNVLGLRMPSRFSSISSIEDAEALAKNLRIDLMDFPIDTLFQDFLDHLSPVFFGKPFGTAEENIQARIRGMILMGVSNKLGHIVLSTGNKSELATGYVTLYGDMCGGLGVINDVSKTLVYKLANWINRKKEIIPLNIIKKAPSAELKANQTDQDELPPYNIVDLVLEEYLENHKSIEEIVKEHGISLEIVKSLVEKIHIAEYKRRQGPPGICVTKKAFSKGRIFPIVQGWI
jgi:NAD+ synthase (glutamine-hydrolysing)